LVKVVEICNTIGELLNTYHGKSPKLAKYDVYMNLVFNFYLAIYGEPSSMVDYF
jgi:hypothetical protein